MSSRFINTRTWFDSNSGWEISSTGLWILKSSIGNKKSSFWGAFKIFYVLDLFSEANTKAYVYIIVRSNVIRSIDMEKEQV